MGRRYVISCLSGFLTKCSLAMSLSSMQSIGFVSFVMEESLPESNRIAKGSGRRGTMSYEPRLMFCGTAGGWSGDVGRLDDSVQQITKRLQISQSQYNASSDYRLCIHHSGPKHIFSVGTDVSEGHGGELSQYRNVELSVAKRFWNVVRVHTGGWFG
jgi:hypothetical protein